MVIAVADPTGTGQLIVYHYNFYSAARSLRKSPAVLA